jgi:hypothetical protein
MALQQPALASCPCACSGKHLVPALCPTRAYAGEALTAHVSAPPPLPPLLLTPAGKTETTKKAMQFFAALAGGTGVEDQVLEVRQRHWVVGSSGASIEGGPLPQSCSRQQEPPWYVTVVHRALLYRKVHRYLAEPRCCLQTDTAHLLAFALA